MAEISPFQGIRYNHAIIQDMGAVICPPYDVISPEEQNSYYADSDYNVIRLEHGLTLPEDNETNNKHNRARDFLNKWLKDQILQIDTTHTFYIYEHAFSYRDTKKKLMGLIACVMLEPWEKKVILPHENTIKGVKADRLELMKASNTNISPILGLYDDPGQKVTNLMMGKIRPSKLLIDISDGDDTHKVWKANEPEFVQRVSHFMSPKSIYIADGHHRYETALAYRDEKRQKTPLYTSYESFNFAMMTLVAFSDPGLIILPIHHVVRNIPSQTLSDLQGKLSEFFEIESSPVSETSLNETRGNARLLGLVPDKILTLKLKPSISINEFMPEGHSLVYKRLDVSIIEHIIMERLLDSPSKKGDAFYTSEAGEARRLTESGQYQLAFLLNPVSVASVKAIADANDRMPRKSTYFYPKLPTGLVINRLDGKL